MQIHPTQAKLVVALVEDDELLREEIVHHLTQNNFLVHGVNCGSGLDDLSAKTAIDLFIIDLNLPGEDGLSLCKRLRKSLPGAGIVILTGKVALHDRLSGYSDGGADAYLTKPVSPDELVLVLRSLSRRIKPLNSENDWTLSLKERILQGPQPEQKLRLTSREKMLLVALIQANDHTLNSDLLCDLYSDSISEEAITKHALEVLVARLRKKLKAVQSADAETAIKSVWGVGYQLCLSINLAN
jgi:DNA-binding response OmpR family regulator